MSSPRTSPGDIPRIATILHTPIPLPGDRSPSPDPLNASFCSSTSHSRTISSSRSGSPARSIRSGPTTTLNGPISPPVQLLRTPPPTDVQLTPLTSYFSPRSTMRQAQTNSPSDNLSASSYLSAERSSGSSYYNDQSPCSHSSGELLSLPPMQPDADNPPYKARRQRSGSLTMIRKPRRARTDPHSQGTPDPSYKAKKRRSRKHRCKHRKLKPHNHQSESPWWLPERQISPTAPDGFKDLCVGRAGNYIPAKTHWGSTDTFGRILTASKSKPATPLLTRRWSSVEVGAHQVHLKSMIPAWSASFSKSPSVMTVSPQFPTPDLKGRYRSSTFTGGAIDHDIIRTVRERLTLRKVPASQLETPASITLRRASGASAMSETSTLVAGLSGGVTPKAHAQAEGDVQQRRPSVTYLITDKDIDTITALIEANLKRQHRDTRRRDARSTSRSPPTSQRTRSPTVTNKGLLPSFSPAVSSPVTAVGITRPSPVQKSPFEYLKVTPAPRGRTSVILRTNSQKSKESTHEVIWQGGGSPQSPGSMTDEEYFKHDRPSSSDPHTPNSGSPKQSCSMPGGQAATKDKGDAFDPHNATASINEWSFRSMSDDIPVIITSSDSESPEPVPPGSRQLEHPKSFESRVSKPNKYASPPQERKNGNIHQRQPRPRFATLAEPVSFPRLPERQRTSDWYSPLPEMDSDPQTQTQRSLYGLGLDMTCGPGDPNTKTPSPKAPRKSLKESAETSRVTGADFDSDYDLQQNKEISTESRSSSFEIGADKNDRRKSSVRMHPKAVARTGETFATGNAIGSSTGERRRSSAKPPKRVRTITIDNAHKTERAGTWGKWRPPSICPTPRAPTPSELEADREDWLSPRTSLQQKQLDQVRTSHGDRLDLLKDKGPPLPKVDHVGIYGRFTGSPKKNPFEDCKEECKPHTCNDCELDPRSPSVDWIG